ncbi:MAG: hypothetical protein GC189_09945 [Alphaproteobacteria bacterium]|nr:hypothetical protein [Alphaproteobacteria bacterium]
MLDLLVLLALIAFAVWIAGRAYARPRGVFWRSLTGVCAASGVMLALWGVARPANEAGFGWFAVSLGVTAIAALVAAVACSAALTRYAVDAFSRR